MLARLRLAGLAALLLGCSVQPGASPDAAAVPAQAAPAQPAPAAGQAEVRHLSATDYPAFIAQADRLVVVDFYADWCGPCRTLGPILERVVASQGAQVALGKLDVDKAKEIAMQEGVKSIPDVRMFVNGKRVDQFIGALPEEEVRNRISRQVATLPKPTNAAQAAPSSPVKRPVAPIGPMDKNWLPPGIERRDKNDKK